MEITLKNKPINNKSYVFLFPVLYSYGERFMSLLSRLRVMVGLGDAAYPLEDAIYLLIDSSNRKLANEFINLLKEEGYYIHSYPYGFATKTKMTMVIAAVPEQFIEDVRKLKEGKYSEMYDDNIIEEYYSTVPIMKKVFKKDYSAIATTIKSIKDNFGVELDPEYIKEHRFEIIPPPLKDTDYFNYKN